MFAFLKIVFAVMITIPFMYIALYIFKSTVREARKRAAIDRKLESEMITRNSRETYNFNIDNKTRADKKSKSLMRKSRKAQRNRKKSSGVVDSYRKTAEMASINEYGGYEEMYYRDRDRRARAMKTSELRNQASSESTSVSGRRDGRR